MTERTQRRAAERKARKAELKKLRNTQPEAISTGVTAGTAVAFEEPSIPAPISEAQLTANRANAQLSSGPKTELGKSISAQNNFRHGLTQTEGSLVLLDYESPEEFAASVAGFEAEWKPETESEHDLVDRLATHRWLRRRALSLQRNFQNPSTGLITDLSQFNLYCRYEVQHERAYNKAMSDLIRIRSLRLREQNGFESKARKDEKHGYQIRHLQHRQKLHFFNQISAEARMTLLQSKLIGVVPFGEITKQPPFSVNGSE